MNSQIKQTEEVNSENKYAHAISLDGKDLKSPPPAQIEEWEDKIRVLSCDPTSEDRDEIISIIRSLLSLAHTEGAREERKRLGQVYKKIEKLKRYTSSEPDATNNPCGFEERISYNMGLQDALNELFILLKGTL